MKAVSSHSLTPVIVSEYAQIHGKAEEEPEVGEATYLPGDA